MFVNEWTNTAAEMVAGFAADQKSATIVGDKTAGNVLGAKNFKVGSRYVLRLPVFGRFTPHETFLEAKGVSPDVRLRADRQLLSSGIDHPMNKAMEIHGAAVEHRDVRRT